MLLSNHEGCRCDRCGISVTKVFIYYSLDLQEIHATSNMLPQLNYRATPVFSFDFCQGCMEEIKGLVLKHYKPTPTTPGRVYPKGLFCDLSGTHLLGNFTVYFCNITQIDVALDRTPPMKILDNRHLELWICPAVFEQMKNRAVELHTIPEQTEWSSTST